MNKKRETAMFFLGCIVIIIISWRLCVTTQPTTTEVCFTPGANCEKFVADKIYAAKNSINVQAYHLTNKRIIKALLDESSAGVDVTIILDKAAQREGYIFALYHIPVFIDNKPAIAHNKVIVLDSESVITGSFNFSESAQKRNAENVVWIKNRFIASDYQNNFDKRLAVSVPLNQLGVIK